MKYSPQSLLILLKNDFKMLKIITVLGARPQFIKAAPVSRVISEDYSDKIKEVIVHTGQHYDANMSDLFFKEMKIPTPDYRLHVGGKSHAQMTAEILIELETLMLKEQPDLVLVYGDTNSTMAAALTASKLHIPVAHVEAGMRGYNKEIPEEVNRVLTDHVTTYFFCTSQVAIDNLLQEGLEEHLYNVGDVMYDAVLFYEPDAIGSGIHIDLPSKYYLATIHRQENTNSEENLCGIFDAFAQLDEPVVLPLHPRTKKYMEHYKISPKNVHILDPVGYFDMLYLIKNSNMVLTDSGGLQKEAYYQQKAVAVIHGASRPRNEWQELFDAGFAKTTLPRVQDINKAVAALKLCEDFSQRFYGEGDAAQKIVRIINENLGSRELD